GQRKYNINDSSEKLSFLIRQISYLDIRGNHHTRWLCFVHKKINLLLLSDASWPHNIRSGTRRDFRNCYRDRAGIISNRLWNLDIKVHTVFVLLMHAIVLIKCIAVKIANSSYRDIAFWRRQSSPTVINSHDGIISPAGSKPFLLSSPKYWLCNC